MRNADRVARNYAGKAWGCLSSTHARGGREACCRLRAGPLRGLGLGSGTALPSHSAEVAGMGWDGSPFIQRDRFTGHRADSFHWPDGYLGGPVARIHGPFGRILDHDCGVCSVVGWLITICAL